MTIYPSTGRTPDQPDRKRKLHFGGDDVIGTPGWNVPPTAQETMRRAQFQALNRRVFGDADPAEHTAALKRRIDKRAWANREIARLEAGLKRPAISASRRVPNPPKVATAEMERRERAIAAARKRREARSRQPSLAASGGPARRRTAPTARWVKLSNGSSADLASFGSRAEAERISRLGR